MAKHLTTDERRAYLLKTLSESRMRAAHAHLEGCTECRSALEEEWKRLAVLNGLTVDEAPDGLAERALARLKPAVPKSRKQLSRRFVNTLAFAAAVVLLLLYAGAMYQALEFGGSERARRALTQNNMKQLGLIFRMYANESRGGLYPALAEIDGVWAPDLAPLQDEYMSDPLILASEYHPSRKKIQSKLTEAWNSSPRNVNVVAELMGDSFAYLGYSVTNESEFEAMMRARASHEIPREVGAEPGEGSAELHPLREGVERFLITDINNPAASTTAQSTIPVLIEISTWKYKDSVEDFKGTNVLYMDGHVEFVKLGTFPVMPSILDALTGGE